MATYIVLASFTDQGVRNVKETTKRARAFREMAAKYGVTVKDMYWTLGSYDVVSILESPDEQTATALGLAVGAMGNIRTQTLRGFSSTEMDAILAKMP